MKGMKPSSSAGSHSSFIKALVSSFVSFSPVRRTKSFTSLAQISLASSAAGCFIIQPYRLHHRPVTITKCHPINLHLVISLLPVDEVAFECKVNSIPSTKRGGGPVKTFLYEIWKTYLLIVDLNFVIA